MLYWVCVRERAIGSVTRFAEILPLCAKKLKPWAIFKGLFSVWQLVLLLGKCSLL